MIKIKETVRSIDKGEKFILEQLKYLGHGVSITTGIQKEEFDKVQMKRKKSTGDDTPLGVYAAMQEFGAPKIPKRPFMLKTMDRTMDLFTTQTMAGMRSIYNGNLTMEKFLKRQKNRHTKWMKDTIKTWTIPSNHPDTIARKAALRRSLSPLQDTNTMLNNIKSKTKRQGGTMHRGLRNLLTIADGRLKEKGRFG